MAKGVLKITKTVVDDLQPGETVWDTQLKGFGVRCQGSFKSYLVRTKVLGKIKWLTIGRHGTWTPENARAEAKKLLLEAGTGLDPEAAKKEAAKPITTVSDLCDRYIREHAKPHKKASSVHEDQALIDNHIKPLIGKMDVRKVTSGDISQLQADIVAGKSAPKEPTKRKDGNGEIKKRGKGVITGGKGVANRVFAVLSKMFNLAEIWQLRDTKSNPVKGIKKFKENQKERFLSEEELQKLHSVMDEFEANDQHQIAIWAIRLILMTGARKSEIINLKWSEVNFAHGFMDLEDSKTGAKRIWMPPQVVELLQTIPRSNSNPYVLVGKQEGKPFGNLNGIWIEIRTTAGIPDVRIHDLRHTFASAGIMNGVPLHAVGKMLGHKSVTTTSRYAHIADKFAAEAAEKVAKAMQKPVKKDKVA